MVPSFVPNMPACVAMEPLMRNKTIRKVIETAGHLLIAIPVEHIISFHLVTVDSVGKLSKLHTNRTIKRNYTEEEC